jgi:phosphoribosylglycinamide formyltransferase 1
MELEGLFMKFCFYVSRKATRIKKIIQSLNDTNEIRHLLSDIVFVFRDDEYDDELPRLCSQHKITFYQHRFSGLKKEERSDILSQELLGLMKQENVDYLFVFGVRLLKGKLLQVYNHRIINFHPSLLPAFPGINAIDQTLNYGGFLFGNTAHFIDESVDAGPVIMQNICVAHNTVSCESILDNQIFMLVQIMMWLKQDRVRVEGRRVSIDKAIYDLGPFVPRLEETVLMSAAGS